MSPSSKITLNPLARGGLFYLSYWLAIAVYAPYINVYFINKGFNGREIGLLSAVTPLMTLLAAPAVTSLADRRGWRARLLALSLAGAAVTLLFFDLPTALWAFYPLMLLLAFFRSPVQALGDSIIVRLATTYNLDFGRMRLWGSISYAVTTVFCGFLWQRYGFSPMFLAAGILLAPVVFLARGLPEDPARAPVPAPRTAPAPAARRRFSMRRADLNPALLFLLASFFMVGAGLVIGESFQGIYINQLGGSKLLVGLLSGLSALSEVPAMHFGRAFTRRFGGKGSLLISYFMMMCGTLVFVVSKSPLMLLAAMVIKGFGYGLYYVGAVTEIDSYAAPERSSTLQAVKTAGEWGLAPLLAAPLGGLFFDFFGAPAAFALAAGLLFLAILLLGGLVVGRRRQKALNPKGLQDL